MFLSISAANGLETGRVFSSASARPVDTSLQSHDPFWKIEPAQSVDINKAPRERCENMRIYIK